MPTYNKKAKRNDFDFYPTPYALCLALCARLHDLIGTPELIIEPSAGSGRFVRAARYEWPRTEIVAIEPNPNMHGELGMAARGDHARVMHERWEDVTLGIAERTLIIGNPPFNVCGEHVRIALERLGDLHLTGPSERYLAFLLPTAFLAGKNRYQDFARRRSLRYVWNIVGRPLFYNDASGNNGGSSDYIFAIWQAGYRGTYEGDFYSWKDE